MISDKKFGLKSLKSENIITACACCIGTAGRVFLNLFPTMKHQSSQKSFISFQRRRDLQIGMILEPIWCPTDESDVNFEQCNAYGENSPAPGDGFLSSTIGFPDYPGLHCVTLETLRQRLGTIKSVFNFQFLSPSHNFI